MTPLPDEIALEGTRLRRLHSGDIPAMIAQLGDARVAAWLAAIGPSFDAADAAEILALAEDPLRQVRALDRGGEMIGCISLGPGIWYWIAPDHSRQGHMRRALMAALPLYFATANPPLTASCRTDNIASIALLSSLGFTRAPQVRRRFFHSLGEGRPCHEYLLTAEQWQAQNQPPDLSHMAPIMGPRSEPD